MGRALRRGGRPARRGRAGLLRGLSAAAAALLVLLFSPASSAQDDASYQAIRSSSHTVLHAPRHAALGREALATLATPLLLPGFGRGAAPEGTTLVLAPSPEAFAAATGGRAPEWAGGVAIPSEMRIVVPAYPLPGGDRRSAAATLRHEIVHLVVHERFPAPVPRWFDEGYAEVASGGWDASAAWTLRVALLLGRTPPLDSLELAWPAAEGRARLAYLLSATMVDHLRRRTGEEGFALLLENWRREGSLDAAVRITWGMTMGQLEEEWRGEVRSRYGWLSLGANLGAIWILALLLGFLALLPRRRRDRARLAAMEAESRMLSPPREDGFEVDYPLRESPDERWPQG